MSADESQPTSPSEESKRKFLAALEAKKQQGASRPGVSSTDSSVNGAHGRAGGRREFRRKSGG